MPARIQGLTYLLGSAKQTNITTVAGSPAYVRFLKLNADIHIAKYLTENDAAEIGKAHEFINNTFPVAWDVAGMIDKFGSAEFTTWAWAYALGNVAFSTPTYTIIPVDPGTTLELPYFPVVQQANESGSSAIDETLVGCALEDVQTVITYGVGRQSVKTTANFVGSGNKTAPSTVTAPAVLAEHYMLGASLALTINGTDYVGGKTILSLTQGFKNNMLLNAGYFPGSGLVSNAAVRGRIEIGERVPTLSFRARLLNNSPEYGLLVSLNNGGSPGTCVATLTYDATHTVTWTWQKVSYQMVERGTADGLITVDVTCAPEYHATNGLVTVTAKCGISTIAQ